MPEFLSFIDIKYKYTHKNITSVAVKKARGRYVNRAPQMKRWVMYVKWQFKMFVA